MKRLLPLLLIALLLLIAYFTKPSDKECTIAVVQRAWGALLPSEDTPEYYEQFMNNESRSVQISDWVFVKRVRYQLPKGDRVWGLGMFGQVFTR